MPYLCETRINTGIKRTAYAIILTLAMGSTVTWAYTGTARYENMRADASEVGEAMAYGNPGYCVPANGAQILGGFAGPEDTLDAVTGHICAR